MGDKFIALFMRFLGAHVSASGGLANSIKAGKQLEINSIQTMFSAPMRWSSKDIEQEQLVATVDAQPGSGVEKILFHGIYLINLARKEKQKFHLSKISLQTHLDASYRLEQLVEEKGLNLDVLGVTFHPGSAIDLTPEEGVVRIAQGLDWVMERVPGGMVLLETSAGAGNIMGDTLEELAEMRDKAKFQDRIGYVLDTQHMFVSGYDWREDLDGVVDQIEKILGLDLVKAIHLNDSMKPFDSHRDRHADLGEGEIGLDAIGNIVNHPKLKEIPFILETPGLKTSSGARSECDLLKEVANE